MLEIDKAIFNQNLLLTQAYCELQLKNTYKNYASILRSFNPVYGGKELFSYKFLSCIYESSVANWVNTEWGRDPLENNLYNGLFEMQLKHKNQIINEIEPKEYKGKILIAEIDQVIRDGVSECESAGFVDYNDCPPIDTWFYIKEQDGNNVLYAWIPEIFENNINNAIDVNALNILKWYTEGRSKNNNWHAENLGEPAKAIITNEENPGSIITRMKKLFS